MNQQEFIDLIKSEMKPALGCTEPVAIGLAVSNTVIYLEQPPEKINLTLSSNIYKNAFAVTIPNTNENGIALSAALGYLLAKEGNTMELFEEVNQELVQKAHELIDRGLIVIDVQPGSRFYIGVQAENKDEKVETITVDRHDNLAYIKKNGKVIKDQMKDETTNDLTKISSMSISELINAAISFPIEDIRFIQEGIEMNRKVAEEGLKHLYGLGIGKNLKDLLDKFIIHPDITNIVKMKTAAASDFRMGGGTMTVMTLLGSGNQGVTAMLPVVYAGEYMRKSNDEIIHAVALSILITIYIKSKVGRLSPICGATLSGAGAAAGIAWLLGGTFDQIEGAVSNMLGNLAGMVCDGAKDGCALKVSTCASEAMVAAQLACHGSIIQSTDGIVMPYLEDTIDNIAKLSKVGMKDVDQNIISMLQEK